MLKFNWLDGLRKAFATTRRRKRRSYGLESILETRTLLCCVAYPEIPAEETVLVDDAQNFDGEGPVKSAVKSDESGDAVELACGGGFSGEFSSDDVPVDENGAALPRGAWFWNGVLFDQVDGDSLSGEDDQAVIEETPVDDGISYDSVGYEIYTYESYVDDPYNDSCVSDTGIDESPVDGNVIDETLNVDPTLLDPQIMWCFCGTGIPEEGQPIEDGSWVDDSNVVSIDTSDPLLNEGELVLYGVDPIVENFDNVDGNTFTNKDGTPGDWTAPVDENGDPLPWGAWFRRGVDLPPDVKTLGTPDDSGPVVDDTSEVEFDPTLLDPQIMWCFGGMGIPDDAELTGDGTNAVLADAADGSTGNLPRGVWVLKPDTVEGEPESIDVTEEVPSDEVIVADAGPELLREVQFLGTAVSGTEIINDQPVVVDDRPIDAAPRLHEPTDPDLDPNVIFYNMAGGDPTVIADFGTTTGETPAVPVDEPTDPTLDPNVILQNTTAGGRGTDGNGIIQPNFRGNHSLAAQSRAATLIGRQDKSNQRQDRLNARRQSAVQRKADRAAARGTPRGVQAKSRRGSR